MFTRPVFEVRQAEQDGGDNIYMAQKTFAVFTANVLSDFLRKCATDMACYKNAQEELYFFLD